MSVSVLDAADELAGGLEEFGRLLEFCEDVFTPLGFGQQRGVLARGPENELPEFVTVPFEPFDRPVFERLPAPHIEVLLARRLAFTPRTDLGPDWVGFLVAHIDAVDAREFAVSCVGEDADVATGGRRPGHPAMMGLDVGLAHAARGKGRQPKTSGSSSV